MMKMAILEFKIGFNLPSSIIGILKQNRYVQDIDVQAPTAPPESDDYNIDVENTVKNERNRVEEVLRSKGMTQGHYPRYIVAFKGKKVSIKFHVPPACGVAHLIVELASHLGLKAEQRGGSDVILRAWNSAIAWQMTLLNPETKGDFGGGIHAEKDGQEGNLCVLIFQSLISADSAEIEFIKQGSFSPKELDALASALKLAGDKMPAKRLVDRAQGRLNSQKSVAALEAMGVKNFGLNETHEVSSPKEISWDNIAGYAQQKRVPSIFYSNFTLIEILDCKQGTHQNSSKLPHFLPVSLTRSSEIIRFLWFSREQALQLDRTKQWSRALDGSDYLPGMVGLNNIKETDFVNVTIQSLMRVTPLRNFFLIPENYQNCKSPLVHRFGELTRKIWHARNFKGQVSPHEFLQAVMKASGKKFRIGAQSDPVAFISWLLNALHSDLKRRGTSIIYQCFQGELEVVKEIHNKSGEKKDNADELTNGGAESNTVLETSRMPFLMLGLDLPPPPLFQDVMEKNIIPQV